MNLLNFSITTVRAGMLMPSASVSVANTTFTRPAVNKHLDGLFERRHHARVMGRESALEALEPLVVAQDVEIAVGERRGALLDDGSDLFALPRLREPQVRVDAETNGVVARGAAEDEIDGRKQIFGRESLDDVDAPWCRERLPGTATVSSRHLVVGVVS